MIRRLAMSGLGVVLLATATVALAQTKDDPKPPAKPVLTAEEQAALEQMKDLHKRLRIARLELALAEAKEAPEREIATKAEDVYRLQGEMHAFRAKHPGSGRLMHQEHPGMRGGRQSAGRGWGRGDGMGRGGRHGMGGRRQREAGRGMGGGRHMSRGAGAGRGHGCPFAERGMGFGRGMGRGRGGVVAPEMGSAGGMRGGRGMGRPHRGTAGRWQHEAEPAPAALSAQETQPAPEATPAK